MKNLLCNKNSTILMALEHLQKNGKRILFIVDDDKKIHGVLTDGDIRNFLLNGHSLSENVSGAMNTNFTYCKEKENYAEKISQLDERIKIIPIVDENLKFVDYIQIERELHLPIASPNLKGNEFKYLIDAFLSTWISSNGAYVKRFETDFAKFCGTRYAIAVSNGTVALHLALVAAGINKADEVILPNLTFAASINSIIHANAKPVLVDVEKDYWTIDPSEIEKAITPKTKAIMPVHIYGQPCDMEAIMKIAQKYKLKVIEDCAEAHGAEFNGKKVGSFGDIGCFSFFGNKVMTTGEGGMCVTNSQELYEKMLILRDHGMSKTKKYWHEQIGYNYRLTNLQAAIGCAQLEKIQKTLDDLASVENSYRKLLGDFSNIEFQKTDDKRRKKITWLASILIKKGKRDQIIQALAKENIDTRPFFYPLDEMPPYAEYGHKTMPNSQNISRQGLNLPTQIDINKNDFEKIKNIISKIQDE